MEAELDKTTLLQNLNDKITRFIIHLTVKNPLQGAGFVLLLGLAGIAGYNILFGNFTIQLFAQQFIIGLSTGSIYALIALGYTLVYGILFMINFAHGEVFMAGAYIGFFAIHAMEESGFLESYTALALLMTVLVGMIASVIVAVLLERIAYRPLRNAPRLVPLITAIGASITLNQLFLLLFGSSPRRFPDVQLYVPGFGKNLINTDDCHLEDGLRVCQQGLDLVGGLYDVNILGMTLRLRPMNFIVLIMSFVFMMGLWTLIQRTKTGRAIRAVAEDKNTSRLMGINVDRVVVITFVLGAALAGAGAVMFSLIPGNGQVTPGMGFTPGIKAFTAAVVGGIGNIPGAMFGGMFLGIMESIGPPLLGMDHQLKDVVSFGLLVFVLIFKPTGFMGEVLSGKKA
jgi:branched-chain amino acid transport system permease protein